MAASSPSGCAPATDGPTASPSPPRISASSGKTSPTTRASPSGPSVELLVDGQPPKVEIIDARTIKYSWDKPNPYFIESQARAAPLFLFRPAHYLKKFHPKYTDPADIASRRGRPGASRADHRRLDVMYANDNIDLPSLNPWVNTTPSPAQRYVFARNPFYHRIDEKGQQLPYIDKVIFTRRRPPWCRPKQDSARLTCSRRYLKMRDYTFLKKSAKSSGVDVRMWESGLGFADRALSQPQRQR